MRLLRRPRLVVQKALVVFAVGALLGSAVVAGPARAATDARATVTEFYATLTQTMQRGAQLSEKARFDALAPAIEKDFDLSAMAQMAVGPRWASLSPAQREQVTAAFTRYTVATYASHFNGASREQLQVGGARQMPYGTIVDTEIVEPGGDQTNVNYLMKQNGNRWQIADVYLQGTISQVAALRSQFSAVVERGGAEALVDTLNKKTASLVPNSEAS